VTPPSHAQDGWTQGKATMGDRWFYIDSAGTQFGPATAAEIREALRMGRATDSCLAWREGLVDWQPIARLARELGMVPTAPPPPPGASIEPPAPPSAPAGAAPADADANPYRAPESAQSERINTTDIAYAGFIRRFAAYCIDGVIVVVLASAVALPLAGSQAVLPGGDPADVMRALVRTQAPASLAQLVIAMLYYTLQESSSAQATLGKRALGIKVTNLQGGRLSFAHALGRWVAATLSYLTLYVGFFLAGFTQRKQALHDLVAGTLVVDQWAFTAQPERQRRGPHGCAVAWLVGFLLLVAVGLVAIAFAVFAIGSNLGSY
jgi:uncharacterized RDD family membrane protein YckC